MKTYEKSGDIVTVTAPYNTTAGQGVLVGTLWGVALTSVSSGAQVEILVRGQATIAKTSATVIAAGDALYWDDTNRVVNKTTTSQLYVGKALAAAGNPSATVSVVFDGLVSKVTG